MTAAVRHCPKHNLDFKGRCPKCRGRHSSSRPANRRGRSAIILERLPRIEPGVAMAELVTTTTVMLRELERTGQSMESLSAAEYTALFRRASATADQRNRELP